MERAGHGLREAAGEPGGGVGAVHGSGREREGPVEALEARGLVGPDIGAQAQAGGGVGRVDGGNVGAAPVCYRDGRRGGDGAPPVGRKGKSGIGGPQLCAAGLEGEAVEAEVQAGARAQLREPERQGMAGVEPVGGGDEDRAAGDLVGLGRAVEDAVDPVGVVVERVEEGGPEGLVGGLVRDG